jgi:tetratricopeptide (TPR) repeat protein
MRLIFQHWYLLLVGAVIGGLIVALSRKPAKTAWGNFKNRAQLIKRYWAFVVPFVGVSILAYALVIILTDDILLRELYINVLGQTVTIIFAIFVGYFAFLQVAESRLDKLAQQGDDEMNGGKLVRATSAYEKALAIDPSHYRVLSNLSELCLIMGNNVRFEELLPRLEKVTKDPGERIAYLYLRSLEHLLKTHITEARSAIGEVVDYAKANPRALETFSWSFDDLRKADVYKELKGEARVILDNYIRYLEENLASDRQRFEAGDYSLAVKKATLNKDLPKSTQS